VARHEQRHQVVAQLGVRRPRLHEEGEDVVAAGALAAAAGDLRVHDRVDARARAQEAPPRAPRPEVPLGGGQHHRLRLREQPDEPPLERPAVLHPEDRTEDDPQRDALHGRQERDGRAGGPRGHLRLGEPAHEVAVHAHALAVKGGEHHPAAAQVLVLVEQEHGVAADERAEDLVALPGVQPGGVAREDAPHLLGVRDDDERVEGPDRDGEDVAVAAPVALEHPVLREQEAEALDGRRQPRSGRTGGAGGPRDCGCGHLWALLTLDRTS
jgi:hypothetical protein